MNRCNNDNCIKFIKVEFICESCKEKFCSNSCKIDHSFKSHGNIIEEKSKNISIKPSTNTSLSSSFMKNGQFLKIVKLDSHYDYKNLSRVKVGNKYQILGQGAFGYVYLTKHKKDGKFYAIKQMQKKKITEAGANNDLIYKEINIHSRLIHDNIIRLYSYDEDEESFYLIMEYANSGNLYNLIKRSGGMNENTAFKYFIQAVCAVYFIHQHNLVHRDIKPENFVLNEHGDLKLCDFGWCVETSLGDRQTFCGTYEYMAPEVVKERPYNQSIDIWSLGILLYELIHGYSPFRAKSNGNDENNEILKNIIKFDFKIEKEISKECADLLSKLLIPNEKFRMKAKDIFDHAWILKYENLNKEGDSNIEKLHNKRDTLNVSKEYLLNKINKEKENSFNEALNNSLHELSNLNNESENLFDKVLTQVKEKNKDKRFRNSKSIEKLQNEEKNKLSNTPALNNIFQTHNMSFEKNNKFEKSLNEISLNNNSFKKYGDSNSKINKNKPPIYYNEEIYNNKDQRNSKRIYNSNKSSNKQIDRDLELDFLPKECLYNDVSYEESKRNILAAIELLENAQKIKKEIDYDKKDKNAWSRFIDYLNPFKCGK